MDETSFISQFKSLGVSICGRLDFSNFPQYRITLRVGCEHPALRVISNNRPASAPASRAVADKNFLLFFHFLTFFNWNFGKNWKNQFFQKFKFYQFFALRCETFDSIFNFDKTYRRIIPSACDIFRDTSFPEMHSNLNLNGWNLIYFAIQILNFSSLD